MSVWPKNCVVAMVIVFISGAIVGAGLMYMFETDPEHFMERRRTPEAQAAHFADFYDEMLDLDKEQYEAFQQVLIKWVVDIRTTMKPIKSKMTARHYDMMHQVKPILSDNQYKKMKAYMDNRYKK